MTQINNEDVRVRAQAIRTARALRVRTIRRRVIGGAVGIFLAAWLLIAVVLVSGHDPVLASKASTVAAVSSSGSGGGSSGTVTTGSSASGTTGASSGSGSSGSGTVSSVSTHQS